MKIKLTKLSGKADSSIQPGYWVIGECSSPVIGEPFWIEPLYGTSLQENYDWFRTTSVLAVDDDVITTKNSKWKMEEVK